MYVFNLVLVYYDLNRAVYDVRGMLQQQSSQLSIGFKLPSSYAELVCCVLNNHKCIDVVICTQH